MVFRRARQSPGDRQLDADAFGGLFEKHGEAIWIYFTRRVHNGETAWDLTSETFAQALRSRRRYRGNTDEDAAKWLYGIARHQLSHFFRRGAAERRAISDLAIDVPRPTSDEIERVEELAELEALRIAIRDALSDLPRDQREALQLRIVDELPYLSIARRLAITEEAVRQRVSRGLKALAATLDDLPSQAKERA